MDVDGFPSRAWQQLRAHLRQRRRPLYDWFRRSVFIPLVPIVLSASFKAWAPHSPTGWGLLIEVCWGVEFPLFTLAVSLPAAVRFHGIAHTRTEALLPRVISDVAWGLCAFSAFLLGVYYLAEIVPGLVQHKPLFCRLQLALGACAFVLGMGVKLTEETAQPAAPPLAVDSASS